MKHPSQKIPSKIARFFGPSRNIVHTSAPGRLDVMGGIADYSGSYVLQMPIAQRTEVYVALRNDGILRAHSQTASSSELCTEVEMPLSDLLPPKRKSSSNPSTPYSYAQEILAKNPSQSWAAYLFGCVLTLIHEVGAPLQGADFWVDSKVAIGKGVSSSAALEVATLSALCHALPLHLPGNDLPLMAQQVENQIVGAPCGLMDQLASYFGIQRKLLPILCRPDRVDPPIDLASGLSFVGVDSGTRHAVSGSSYSDVRTAAFMGYSIIAHHMGISRKKLLTAKTKGTRDELPYEGYLTQIPPSLFESRYESRLPDRIRGAEFIQQYGDTIDPITTPQADRDYAVQAGTAHPIYEHHRVRQFGLLLHQLNTPRLSKTLREEIYLQLGEFMLQSHQSYSRCGLGSEATDALVDEAIRRGPSQGIYGAKITGGGSGGTVCFLCVGKTGLQTVQQIAADHAVKHQCPAVLFSGSSNGAHWTQAEQIRS